MSPKKKKMRMADETKSTSLKRQSEGDSNSTKRSKSAKNPNEEIQAKRRKNFVTACEQVSCKAYFDHRARLLLLYLPSCMKSSVCKHDSKTSNVKEMSSKAEEAFMIDARTNMWCEALEVCLICITPNQYLSARVLKEIVEIMLNAHEDEYAGHSVSYVIDKCQEILMQNFSTHPPCLIKTLKKCYNNFLTSPLELREKTFTNRTSFGCEKGIVKYCMNRLEYELSPESKDECLVNKYENIPEEMKESVKGLHWQKEKFEIFECHNRPERIERLMAVLDSIIELLQFDLAIWHSRYSNNLGSHIMRSHKPLMAYVLWSNNVLFTGAVNGNCRQILRLFVYIVHLRYPESYIKTMTIWLNTVIQTFYICETNSNSDYPNTGKYCIAFANEFYKIISGLPQDSITRILEKIHPPFMKHLIGTLHVKKLLMTEETCIITNLFDFIKESRWKTYPESADKIEVSKSAFFKLKKIKRKLRYLTKKCESKAMEVHEDVEIKLYPKIESVFNNDGELNQNQIVHTLFITLEAYLDSYSVQSVQETLDNLNENLLNNDEIDLVTHNFLPELGSYSVTEQFIKKYRTMYQMLRELIVLMQEIKSRGDLPDVLKVFENIDLLSC